MGAFVVVGVVAGLTVGSSGKVIVTRSGSGTARRIA